MTDPIQLAIAVGAVGGVALPVLANVLGGRWTQTTRLAWLDFLQRHSRVFDEVRKIFSETKGGASDRSTLLGLICSVIVIFGLFGVADIAHVEWWVVEEAAVVGVVALVPIEYLTFRLSKRAIESWRIWSKAENARVQALIRWNLTTSSFVLFTNYAGVLAPALFLYPATFAAPPPAGAVFAFLTMILIAGDAVYFLGFLDSRVQLYDLAYQRVCELGSYARPHANLYLAKPNISLAGVEIRRVANVVEVRDPHGFVTEIDWSLLEMLSIEDSSRRVLDPDINTPP